MPRALTRLIGIGAGCAVVLALVWVGVSFVFRSVIWGSRFDPPPAAERAHALELDIQKYLEAEFPGARVVQTEFMGYRTKGGFGPGFDLVWTEVENSREKYWLVEVQPQWGTGYYVRQA